jgi:hypothetical protein
LLSAVIFIFLKKTELTESLEFVGNPAVAHSGGGIFVAHTPSGLRTLIFLGIS